MSQRDQFEQSWPWLAAAMKRTGETHTKEQIWAEIEADKAQLHPLSHSAMVTTVPIYPSGLKELNIWLAGGDLGELVKYLPAVEQWARDEGCANLRIVGREGWKRVLADHGYRDRVIVLTKELAT